jgi:amino acid adenylation domain-containing protein
MNFADVLIQHATSQPHALAATADGEEQDYAELARQAGRLGSWLHAHQIERVAILGSRSLGAFVGVLGAAWAGAAYVPLSLKAPPSRLIDILRQAHCGAILIDRHGAKLLNQNKNLASAFPRLVVAADGKARDLIGGRCGNAPVVAEISSPSIVPVRVSPDDTAYIIFTSGTTGVPKGVVVSFGARAALIDGLRPLYDIGPSDRVAETIELSFDISVANMILAWQNGASLHAVPATSMIAPSRFIRANSISVWTSVPTVITTMMRTGTLKSGIFSSLRYSIFAGEGLSRQAAAAWRQAAPHSCIDNLYGPTEATVYCLGHRADMELARSTGPDMIPIGHPFHGLKAAIVDENRCFVAIGHKGELAVAGRQLAKGYLDRPDLTDTRFRLIDGERWYLTGDGAYQDEDGLFHHLGRLDNQIKVLGNRVELEEVESHLRSVTGAISAAVIGWPQGSAAESLVAFTVGAKLSVMEARCALAERLPTYMVPSAIYDLEAMPLTSNGKLDRARLVAMLDQPIAANG